MSPNFSLGQYYVGAVLRPGRTFDALMQDPRRLQLGTWAMLINGVLYTLVYVFLTMAGGAPSSFKPWLAIPADVYYRYDRWILFPSMFGCWILAAGTAQLLSRFFGGKGTFEDMLSAFGIAAGVSSLASLLHDLPDAFLAGIGLLDARWYEAQLNSPTIWRTILWILYGLFFVLFLVLFPKAVRSAQRIKTVPAIAIGVFSFVVYQGVFFIFNR